jgi:hypothetical protein
VPPSHQSPSSLDNDYAPQAKAKAYLACVGLAVILAVTLGQVLAPILADGDLLAGIGCSIGVTADLDVAEAALAKAGVGCRGRGQGTGGREEGRKGGRKGFVSEGAEGEVQLGMAAREA